MERRSYHRHAAIPDVGIGDLLIRRVLVPLIFSIGLFGLVRYALTGAGGGMGSHLPLEQPAASIER